MTVAVQPDKIRWLSEPDESSSEACSVCGGTGAHFRVLEVCSLASPHVSLTLLRCTQCGSGFYVPRDVFANAEAESAGDAFWRHYVEVGAGIWETIWPVLVDVHPGRRRLLDVGCGFGFLVDYWQRVRGAEAVGVELASYGAIGARLLGITVHRQDLQHCAALADRKFDVVYASEVIEHVDDPRSFVQTLARFVAEDGVVVLTTPAMEYVTAENSSPTLLAALAPGFHKFLLSRRALTETARSAGFAHIEVRRFGERQVLWASQAPLQLDFAVDRLRSSLVDYFDGCLQRAPADSPLWQGIAYRLVRDRSRAQQWAEAKASADALVEALQRTYGREVLDPAAMAVRVSQCSTLEDWGRTGPYFLPCLYFQLGLIAQHYDRDPWRALEMYRGAADLATRACRLGAHQFLEAGSLIWPARISEALLMLELGEYDRAATMLVQLVQSGERGAEAAGFATVRCEYVQEVTQRACMEFANRGAWPAARLLFQAHLEHLAAHLPAHDWTARATIEGRFHDPRMPKPEDTDFAFFFQAALDAASGRSPEAFDRLRALMALSETLVATNAQRQTLIGYAASARRLFPVLAQAPGTGSTTETSSAEDAMSDPVGAAEAAMSRSDFSTAESIATRALADKPRDTHLLNLQGCARLRRGNFEGARDALARAAQLVPRDPFIQYNLGNACMRLADHLGAIHAMLAATSEPSLASDAWFKIGRAFGRLRLWQRSAAAMLLAARRAPGHADAMVGMAEGALQLLRAGEHAPPRDRCAPAGGKLSFIVCSVRPAKLERLRARLGALLTDGSWELIAITDAKSLCEAYNRGIAASRGELLVLCHDDILLLADDFERRLRGYLAEFELIGVAGGVRINGPSWSWSGPPHIHCWVAHLHEQREPVVLLLGTQGPSVTNACVLDGVFLAGQRAVFEWIGFDSATFDGFHLYDIDFSYRAALAGVRSAVCLDLGLLHESAGRYDLVWKGYADRFLRKFAGSFITQSPGMTVPRLKLDSPEQLAPLQDWLATWTSETDDSLERRTRLPIDHAFSKLGST